MGKRQGLVVEVHDKWAIILSEKGQYKKVRPTGYLQVGEIWYGSSTPVWKVAAAAVIIVMLAGACIDFFSVVAYAQVSSGVKIGVNRWDRVISVEATNDQAVAYVKKAKLKGKKVGYAIDQVVSNTAVAEGNKPVLEVTTTKKDENNRQRLLRLLNKRVKSDSIQGNTNQSHEKMLKVNATPNHYKKNEGVNHPGSKKESTAPTVNNKPSSSEQKFTNQGKSAQSKDKSLSKDGQAGKYKNESGQPVKGNKKDVNKSPKEKHEEKHKATKNK